MNWRDLAWDLCLMVHAAETGDWVRWFPLRPVPDEMLAVYTGRERWR